MKKLLLIPLLFLITPGAKADMNYICEVGAFSIMGDGSFITKNCERNNIIKFNRLGQKQISEAISRWCRHDREINFVELTRVRLMNTDDYLVNYDLVCVLYDNKPRTFIEK